MSLQRQAMFWALAAIVLIAFLYVFSNILLPFVAGMAIAYLLDPTADWFERRGFSRLWATLTITVLALLIFVVGLLLLVPLLIEQLVGLVEALRPFIPETLRTIFGLADEDFQAINAIMAPASEDGSGDPAGLFSIRVHLRCHHLMAWNDQFRSRPLLHRGECWNHGGLDRAGLRSGRSHHRCLVDPCHHTDRRRLHALRLGQSGRPH